MANHVSSYFNINFPSESECTRFAEWIGLSPIDENITWGERTEACCNIMMDNLWEDKEDTRSWWIDNVGAKWMYFDDIAFGDDTSVYINMTSAWDFPEGLFFKLSDLLRDQFPNAVMQVTFEDEGYNFIGAAASNQEFRDVEYHHPDFDELDEYKDDEDCWSDEFYEEMDERRQMVLDEVLSFIQQDASE
jgi:hypothetical protein